MYQGRILGAWHAVGRVLLGYRQCARHRQLYCPICQPFFSSLKSALYGFEGEQESTARKKAAE
jgi:hypothetical protein